MFSTTSLNQDDQPIVLQSQRNDGVMVIIRVKLVGEVTPTDYYYVQFFNIVLRQAMEKMGLTLLRVNFNNNSQGGRSLDNNNLKSIEETSKDCKKGSRKKIKYNRRELKRLISAPKKSGRPLSFGLYCNLCGAGFPTTQSLRRMDLKHEENLRAG